MMSAEEKKGSGQGKYTGEYIGIVEDVNDPKKMMRVRVRVFGIFTDKVPVEDLPWAEYRLPIGARVNDGFFTPVDKGDYVWLTFPFDGDTRRPVLIGSVHHTPDGIPSMPHEAFVGPENIVHKRTGEEPPPAAHKYHEDAIFTQHGFTVEICKDKSMRIVQRDTGTEIDIDPKGNITFHGEKNLFFSTVESLKGLVGKDITITAQGHTTIVSMGKMDLDGGSADLSGVVTKLCICPFTGKPHSDYSLEVQASKG